MKKYILTTIISCAFSFLSLTALSANYGINNNQVWFNDPNVTDYVIFFIGRDGANMGGIFMNKNESDFRLGLDHGHIQANAGWNQYKFVYMTGTGQKETDWISKNGGPQTNNDPVANNDSAMTVQNQSVEISVLANDTDPDGDNLTITNVSNPPNGSTVINGNNITYTPNAEYSGNDTFTYTISDGKGGNATASVNITVRESQPTGNSDYGVNSSQAFFNDPVATDYVIFFIGRDNANLGGVFMDKNSPGFTLNLDHGHIQANSGWNQYKFVYMTATGQKETDWISLDDNPNPGDTTPPSVPSGLNSSNITENSLTLSWNASTDDTAVTGYQVFMDGHEYQTVSGTIVDVSSLTPDTSYNFSVKAFDAAGNISAASAQVTVKTLSTPNHDPNLFPIKIVNTSGRPDNQVYVTVIGRFPEPDKMHIMGRLNFETSELVPIKVADNDPQNDNKCSSYYRRLTDLTYEGENTYSFYMPRIASARMYISIDKPAYFHVNEEPAGLAEPNVLAENEIKSGHDTIYDIIEITWLHDQDLFVNTSNVDFLSIPFQVEMKMKDGSSVIRGYTKSRNEIFDLAEQMGAPWNGNIVRNEFGEPLRFLGGTFGTVTGNIPEDYLQPAIDNAWEHFKSFPIHTYFEGWQLENGYVNGNEELHITASRPAHGSETFTIAKPTSREGFASEGVLANGSIIERKIQAFIGAAINRGVIGDTHDWWNWNEYYKDTPNNQGLYNKYAELLHSVSIEGRCYGFSYDDVNGLDSSIWLPNEKELIITIPEL